MRCRLAASTDSATARAKPSGPWLRTRSSPVPVDQVNVHLAADQRAQALRNPRAFEHVKTQVPDARDERVAADRAGGEDVVGEAAGVGVLLADAPPGLVHQEPVEDVGRFVDGGRDGLGGERDSPPFCKALERVRRARGARDRPEETRHRSLSRRRPPSGASS